jgi:hypothetical protein
MRDGRNRHTLIPYLNITALELWSLECIDLGVLEGSLGCISVESLDWVVGGRPFMIARLNSNGEVLGKIKEGICRGSEDGWLCIYRDVHGSSEGPRTYRRYGVVAKVERGSEYHYIISMLNRTVTYSTQIALFCSSIDMIPHHTMKIQ